MSVATGTATDYLDLLNKLRTFLTTDAALVAAGQNWTEVDYTTSPGQTISGATIAVQTCLKGPGLSGGDQIYVNIRAFFNATSDYYNWELKGSTGYNAGNSFDTQPGANASADTFMLLWNQPITYWFFANGQRFIVVAKISSIYESCYAGKFLPYGTPGQYPYPVAVGGSYGGFNVAGTTRFSDTSSSHTAFFNPASLFIYYIDGSWYQFYNPIFNSSDASRQLWPYSINWDVRDNLDGTYPLFPCRLEMRSPAANVLGELDGVCWITGFQNAAENTVTIGGDTYLVFPNIFRTGGNDYVAIKDA